MMNLPQTLSRKTTRAPATPSSSPENRELHRWGSGAEKTHSRACAIGLVLLSVVQTDVLVLELGWTATYSKKWLVLRLLILLEAFSMGRGILLSAPHSLDAFCFSSPHEAPSIESSGCRCPSIRTDRTVKNTARMRPRFPALARLRLAPREESARFSWAIRSISSRFGCKQRTGPFAGVPWMYSKAI